MLTSLLLLVSPYLPAVAPAPARVDVGAASAAQTPEMRAARYDDLLARYLAAEKEWMEERRDAAIRGLPNRAEIEARHPSKKFWEAFAALAGEGEGRATLWMAQHVEEQETDKAQVARRKLELFQQLIRDYAGQPWSGEIAQALAVQRRWIETDELVRLLREFASKATNKDHGALALIKVYGLLTGVGAKAEALKVADEVKQTLLRDFADTAAAKKLAADDFKQKHLLPGREAPDFSAEDVEGVAFKLSDYRGKVVLLDFWGFW